MKRLLVANAHNLSKRREKEEQQTALLPNLQLTQISSAFSLKRTRLLERQQSLDLRMMWRNALICLNVFLSLLFMIVSLELEWSNRDKDQNIRAESRSKGLRICISLLTFFLLLQIIESYLIRMEIKLLDYELLFLRQKTKGRRWLPGRMELKAAIWRSARERWMIWLELLATLPHPYSQIEDPTAIKILSLLMFLRLYCFLRIFKDVSQIYKNRSHLKALSSVSSSPTFDTLLSVKMFFYFHPISFVLLNMVANVLICSYCCYVFERDSEHEPPFDFDLGISIYVITVAMFTGWPADPFDQYNPSSWGGKMICLISTINGIFQFSLLIDYLHTQLRPTPVEESSFIVTRRSQIEETIREESARLIQILWRRHVWLKRNKTMKNKAIRKTQKKAFTEAYVKQLKKIRNMRGKRLVLEALSPNAREEGMTLVNKITSVVQEQTKKISSGTDANVEEQIRAMEARLETKIHNLFSNLLLELKGGTGEQVYSINNNKNNNSNNNNTLSTSSQDRPERQDRSGIVIEPDQNIIDLGS